MSIENKSDLNERLTENFGPKRKPVLNGPDNDIVITANILQKSGWCETAFRASDVRQVYKLKDEICVIVLDTGEHIKVARKFDELRRRIFLFDSSEKELDLTADTGSNTGSINLKSGDVAPDGSIYLGLYNNKDWFVAAEDAKNNAGQNLLMTFNAAAKYSSDFKMHDCNDWILPPGMNDPKEPNILREMFDHRNVGAFKDTFNRSDSPAVGWYWASTLDRSGKGKAYQIKFLDGFESSYQISNEVSVRYVRAVPRL